jgi:hypothetical protein
VVVVVGLVVMTDVVAADEDVGATEVVVVLGTANGVVSSRREKPKAAMPSRTPQMTTTMARDTEDKRIAGHCGSPVTYDLGSRF